MIKIKKNPAGKAEIKYTQKEKTLRLKNWCFVWGKFNL